MTEPILYARNLVKRKKAPPLHVSERDTEAEDAGDGGFEPDERSTKTLIARFCPTAWNADLAVSSMREKLHRPPGVQWML